MKAAKIADPNEPMRRHDLISHGSTHDLRSVPKFACQGVAANLSDQLIDTSNDFLVCHGCYITQSA